MHSFFFGSYGGYGRRDLVLPVSFFTQQRFLWFLQDGKLISGNIYDNITLSYPDADSKEVKAVPHAIGLAEDIARMPMGRQIMVSETCEKVFTGQKAE